MKLSAEQKKVIEYDKGFLNVAAGAGTGKTTVLIERIKYLMSYNYVLPENILVLTYNKKNVYNLKKHFSNIKIMTFHGLSTSILKKYSHLLKKKYNCEFKIMNESQTETIIKTILKSDNELFPYRGDFSNIKYTISKIKKNLINQNVLEENELFKKFFNKYSQYLQEYNLMDFDDLNKYAFQLLSDEYICDLYKDKYHYILIDEVQDIDFYQYSIIKLLTQNELFIFGDSNQSIYGFRGAKNIYIDLLVQEFNMETFYLKINYRSSPLILELANNLINYNYEEKDKYKLIPFVKGSFNDRVLDYYFDNSFIENCFIAGTIKELIKNENYKYDDIVILFRKNYLMDSIKDKFFVNNIPYMTNKVEKSYYKKSDIEVKIPPEIKKFLDDKLKECQKTRFKNKVLLSTIHQIKGLEFKVVFLVGFEQETFINELLHTIDIKEERRLAYVAITRAKERLYITISKERMVYGNIMKMKPAIFLEEMGIK